jgi:hypothetical protein
MTNPILHKSSAVATAVPAAASLTVRELALNTADGRLFTKTGAGTVVEFARKDLVPSGSGTSTGTNTGDQTTITGNAGSATTLSAGADRTKLDAITGTNTGDETTATIKTKLGITTLSGSNTGDQTIPTTLPASDVYAWAKAATKPTYSAAEVGALTPTGSAAALTGLTSTQVTTALGYTPAAAGGMSVSVISANTTAVSGSMYVLTASLTLTLPASPSAGATVYVSNRSATTTCIVARNAQNIMGLAEDITLDLSASFQLVFADATRGWVLL